MQDQPGLASAVRSFVDDETGGTFMEFTLIAAIVLVLLALLVLAIFKIGFSGP